MGRAQLSLGNTILEADDAVDANEHSSAKGHLDEALRTFKDNQYRAGELQANAGLARWAILVSKYSDAVAYGNTATAIGKDNPEYGQAEALLELATAKLESGDLEEAEADAAEAKELFDRKSITLHSLHCEVVLARAAGRKEDYDTATSRLLALEQKFRDEVADSVDARMCALWAAQYAFRANRPTDAKKYLHQATPTSYPGRHLQLLGRLTTAEADYADGRTLEAAIASNAVESTRIRRFETEGLLLRATWSIQSSPDEAHELASKAEKLAHLSGDKLAECRCLEIRAQARASTTKRRDESVKLYEQAAELYKRLRVSRASERCSAQLQTLRATEAIAPGGDDPATDRATTRVPVPSTWMPLFLVDLLERATNRLKSVEFAWAVVALAAAGGIAIFVMGSQQAAVVGVPVTLVLVVSYQIIAWLLRNRPERVGLPATIVLFGVAIVFVLLLFLLLSCAFFRWPMALSKIGTEATTSEGARESDAPGCGEPAPEAFKVTCKLVDRQVAVSSIWDLFAAANHQSDGLGLLDILERYEDTPVAESTQPSLVFVSAEAGSGKSGFFEHIFLESKETPPKGATAVNWQTKRQHLRALVIDLKPTLAASGEAAELVSTDNATINAIPGDPTSAPFSGFLDQLTQFSREYRFIVLDGFDEISPAANAAIVHHLESSLHSTSTNVPVVVLLGRPESFVGFIRYQPHVNEVRSRLAQPFETDTSTYELQIPTSSIPLYATDVVVYGRHQRSDFPGDEVIEELLRASPAACESFRNLSLAYQIVLQARNLSGIDEGAREDVLFSAMLARNAGSHGRPDRGDNRYLSALEEAAAAVTVDASGGFWVKPTEVVPFGQQSVSLSKLLDRSGIITRDPSDGLPARYEFMFSWIPRHLQKLRCSRLKA